jgi:HSP20 family protein
MLYPTTFMADPFALMRRMSRDLDRAFGAEASAFPAVNVWQSEEAVAITAELPGIEPSDIEITVKDNLLTLTGERKAPDIAGDATWHRRERAFGRFARTIRLPFPARDDQVQARFANGVLRIAVARPEEDRPRRIEIKAA